MKSKALIKELTTHIIADRAGCLAKPGQAILDALEKNCTPKEMLEVRAALAPSKSVQRRLTAQAAGFAKPYGAVPAAKAAPAKSDPDVNEFEAIVGPYGTEFEAKQEVTQFRHPNVFAYRSAMFPTPQNFGVEVKVLEASVTKVQNPNPLYPYGVKLQIAVRGPRAKDWITSFKNRARLFNAAG